jgi:hypothetical protein
LLRVDETISVDARVVQLDLVERRLGSLDRGKLPFAVELQELRSGKKSDIAHARAPALVRLSLPNERPLAATKLALPRGSIASFPIDTPSTSSSASKGDVRRRDLARAP